MCWVPGRKILLKGKTLFIFITVHKLFLHALYINHFYMHRKFIVSASLTKLQICQNFALRASFTYYCVSKILLTPNLLIASLQIYYAASVFPNHCPLGCWHIYRLIFQLIVDHYSFIQNLDVRVFPSFSSLVKASTEGSTVIILKAS